jgi:hypothetical protein
MNKDYMKKFGWDSRRTFEKKLQISSYELGLELVVSLVFTIIDHETSNCTMGWMMSPCMGG